VGLQVPVAKSRLTHNSGVREGKWKGDQSRHRKLVYCYEPTGDVKNLLRKQKKSIRKGEGKTKRTGGKKKERKGRDS